MCFPLFKKSFTLASEVSIEDYDNGDDNNDNSDNDSDTNLGEDIRKLDYGQHVERKRTLRTRGIKMLELEEADKILNKGFKDQIYDVYRYLPPATQVCTFVLTQYIKQFYIYQFLIEVCFISATLPHEILEMTIKFMLDPIRYVHLIF